MTSLPVVDAYFEADRKRNIDALIELFIANAVVKDEGTSHKGINAIRAWWNATKEKYQHVAEPVKMTVTGNKAAVRAMVSGQFPASPLTLNYLFTLEQNQIIELEIQP